MTPSDLVALVARLRNFNPPDRTVDELRPASQAIYDAAAAIEQLQRESMSNFNEAVKCKIEGNTLRTAIEQLQAELLEYQQCLDAGIEHRMRRKAETEAESLRAELAAVKRDAERWRFLSRNVEWHDYDDAGKPVLKWTPRKHPDWIVRDVDAAIDAARAQAGGK